MKKTVVLIVLFALPIVAYLFFSSGVNNFVKLPTLTSNVKEINNFSPLNEGSVKLEDKITILSVYGSDIEKMGGNAFNLNEKIYDKNYEFNDFQFVVLAEDGTQEQAKKLLQQIGTTINPKKWNFVFGSTEQIQKVFESLQTDLELDKDFATPYTFIIDKERNLRGRNDDEKIKDGTLYGYNTSLVGQLSNKMVDDVKVILAEYRLELKKYKDRK
ncbi:hypothetical protein [Haloflavibacter putidus]|uniref:Membrane or secreted protein n=1 Tax=Haloflavibacter putidus TaxID=2576776 RepID=A0A507ZQK6_9FLAO|nr:hypothetical protein [Haloflavibacter putidus]TQD39629.1 hypothetical protein FKR84_03795 [Haloflavibacter putidus]